MAIKVFMFLSLINGIVARALRSTEPCPLDVATSTTASVCCDIAYFLKGTNQVYTTIEPLLNLALQKNGYKCILIVSERNASCRQDQICVGLYEISPSPLYNIDAIKLTNSRVWRMLRRAYLCLKGIECGLLTMVNSLLIHFFRLGRFSPLCTVTQKSGICVLTQNLFSVCPTQNRWSSPLKLNKFCLP